MLLRLAGAMTTAFVLAASGVSQQPVQTALGTMPFLGPRSLVEFQGDSITDGGRWRTGQDFNHIMGQDYGYILAGELGAAFPNRDLTFVNRGISGDRVLDLAARWQQDTLALRPNVLSVLVGINDTLATGDRAESVEQFEATYDKLLAQTIAELPGVKIVLGEPFLLPVGKHRTNYEAELAEVRKRQQVVAGLAAKYRLAEVHYQALMDSATLHAPPDHWSWDGVHPTYAGHWLMAQEWLRVVQTAWGDAADVR